MAWRKLFIFNVMVSFCFTIFSTVALAKPPVCKSLNGRLGLWQYNVGADYSEAYVLLQMFRKKQFDLRMEFFGKQGYFQINGKQRKNIATARVIVDGVAVATYTQGVTKAGKPTSATWRGNAFNKIYNGILKGKMAQVLIKKTDGKVHKFDMMLTDYQKSLYASVPHYNYLTKRLTAKQCRGAFDF